LRFESNNTTLLLCLFVAVIETSILLHIPTILCPTTWRRMPGDHR